MRFRELTLVPMFAGRTVYRSDPDSGPAAGAGATDGSE